MKFEERKQEKTLKWFECNKTADITSHASF